MRPCPRLGSEGNARCTAGTQRKHRGTPLMESKGEVRTCLRGTRGRWRHRIAHYGPAHAPRLCSLSGDVIRCMSLLRVLLTGRASWPCSCIPGTYTHRC